MFVNPTVTAEDGDADDMPFMELDLLHHIQVKFSTSSTKEMDFEVISQDANIISTGLYF